MENRVRKEMRKRTPLSRPSFGKDELMAVKRVFESEMLTEWRVTEEFERAFAGYVGVKHAIARAR